MALRNDSYGSVANVQALTRHLLDGAATFSNQTRPTLVEEEGRIGRGSAMLNMALLAESVATPLTNEVAVLAAAQWVIRQAAAEVELTQRGTGYSDDEGSRLAGLRMRDVTEIAGQIAAALRQSAATGTERRSAGLSYTGLTKRGERTLDDGYEQAMFRRGQFDA